MTPALPQISVIIPAYKAMATLEKAVESVRQQTFQDWELLIVNDASPDDTGALANHLAAADPRIQVLHLPENRGKPNAMNVGTDTARGTWIALLDADDWYAPERLEKLLAAAGDDVQMVADNQFFFDGKANQIAGMAFPGAQPVATIGLKEFLAAADAMASFDYGMLKPIFRSDFLRQHNIRYYEPAKVGEDFLILLTFFAVGGRARLLPEPLYYYLQPFGTISKQWAQDERKPYDFVLLEQINAYGLQALHDKLKPTQRTLLVQRGRDIAALARFDRLRTALKQRRLFSAMQLILTAPMPFWRLVEDRLLQRFNPNWPPRPRGQQQISDQNV